MNEEEKTKVQQTGAYITDCSVSQNQAMVCSFLLWSQCFFDPWQHAQSWTLLSVVSLQSRWIVVTRKVLCSRNSSYAKILSLLSWFTQDITLLCSNSIKRLLSLLSKQATSRIEIAEYVMVEELLEDKLGWCYQKEVFPVMTSCRIISGMTLTFFGNAV